jgi:hypothetical protein
MNCFIIIKNIRKFNDFTKNEMNNYLILFKVLNYLIEIFQKFFNKI